MATTERYQKCSQCGLTKILHEFAIRMDQGLRRRSKCRQCMNTRRMYRYHAIPAVHKMVTNQTLKWQRANREHFREYQNQYRLRNPDRVKAWDLKHANKNPNRMLSKGMLSLDSVVEGRSLNQKGGHRGKIDAALISRNDPFEELAIKEEYERQCH